MSVSVGSFVQNVFGPVQHGVSEGVEWLGRKIVLGISDDKVQNAARIGLATLAVLGVLWVISTVVSWAMLGIGIVAVLAIASQWGGNQWDFSKNVLDSIANALQALGVSSQAANGFIGKKIDN